MASGINFTGVGSGIDFGIITDSIIAQRRVPIAQLQTRRDTMNQRGTLLRQFNALLATLTESAKALTDRGLGTGRSASSSDTNILTATGTPDASAGGFSVKVERLASSFTQATAGFASATSPVLTGGETSATLKLRTGGDAAKDVTVTVDSTNNTLEGLRDAINKSGAGVSAAIVDVAGDGTQNRLVLTSKGTGAAGRVELVDDSASLTHAGLGLASLNPPGATNDFSDLDAKLAVGGLTLYRPTNTVSDAVKGVTLGLKAVGTSAVTVAPNSDEINLKLRSFVEAYNAVQDFVAAQYKPDSTGRPAGVLVGDPTLRGVQSQLREALGAASTSNGGSLNSLTQLGVSRDEAGKLKFDSAALNERLKTSLPDVKALLAGATESQTGLAQSIYNSYVKLSDNTTGMVQEAVKGYTSSAAGLDKTIAAQEERLDALRVSLTRRFTIADAAIGTLNSQGSTLTSLIQSFQNSTKPK